ncbi:MAG: hypothetical protein PHI66_00740 [Candidatus Pacebacteria bacterium]|nr:hypothetical protein [Candidatus Paceibacterota bacterium]
MNIKKEKNILPKKTVIVAIGISALLAIPEITAAALTPITGVPTKSISDVLGDATNWLIGLGISLCILLLIWGGVYYVGSSGDQEKTQTAKKIIKYALMGIFIIGVSYAIISVIDDIFAS